MCARTLQRIGESQRVSWDLALNQSTGMTHDGKCKVVQAHVLLGIRCGGRSKQGQPMGKHGFKIGLASPAVSGDSPHDIALDGITVLVIGHQSDLIEATSAVDPSPLPFSRRPTP